MSSSPVARPKEPIKRSRINQRKGLVNPIKFPPRNEMRGNNGQFKTLESDRKHSDEDKKKEKKQKKKYLKSMDMTKMPSMKVYEKLWDIYYIIAHGLKDCVEKVLELNL